MKRNNLRIILINICCFFILLYPFNSTIAGKIYPKYYVIYASVIICQIILIACGRENKLNRKKIFVFIITLLIVLLEVLSNKYINKTKMIIYTVYLFLPLTIVMNRDSINAFKKSIKIFMCEHLIFTYLAVFFKTVYANYILPFLDSAQKESLASSHFKSGFNPGFTTHYSTNGMYMALICIFCWSEFLREKNKKNIILIIISFIALMLTGKKGHAIFTIITCIIMYFIINKNKIPKKVFNLTILIVGGIIVFFVCSSFIPQVTIVVDRFNKTINSNGDLLTGRNEFYELALDIWRDHSLFGAGWGAFSNYYQIYLFKRFGVSYLDAHNVYIQLLCETGIIGFLFIVYIMLRLLYKSVKNVKNNENNLHQLMSYFSIGYQIFFLLYCLSGNPLYDPQCYVIYFMCIGISLILEEKKYEKNRNSNVSQSQ